MYSPEELYIIAEAGVNHNGDYRLALRLMAEAKKAGADAIKYQMFDPATLVTEDLEKAPYQIKETGKDGKQKDMLEKLMLTFEEFKKLSQRAKDLNIDFIVTPFDIPSVAIIEPYVDAFKMSSGDLTYIPLLQEITKYKKPLIISTGMGSIKEIAEVVQHLEKIDFPAPVAFLHCVSVYPTPPVMVTLNFMNRLRQFGLPVGYSDHTEGIGVPIASAGLGATVIEKHITLDRDMLGPDHKAALEPHMFKLMVEGCKEAVLATRTYKNDSKWGPFYKEAITFRRSIKASKDLKAGTVLTAEDVKIVRPATGLSPNKLNVVIGMVLTTDVSVDSDILWECFK